MSGIARFACAVRGHDEQTLMLPEDGWGLYAVSRIVCKRCGTTTFERYAFAELAQYNSERGRGLVHDPSFIERMAIQQEYWRDQQEASA